MRGGVSRSLVSLRESPNKKKRSFMSSITTLPFLKLSLVTMILSPSRFSKPSPQTVPVTRPQQTKLPHLRKLEETLFTHTHAESKTDGMEWHKMKRINKSKPECEHRSRIRSEWRTEADTQNTSMSGVMVASSLSQHSVHILSLP